MQIMSMPRHHTYTSKHSILFAWYTALYKHRYKLLKKKKENDFTIANINRTDDQKLSKPVWNKNAKKKKVIISGLETGKGH